MNITFLTYQNSDNKFIWSLYRSMMQVHIERIWGWDYAWQRNDFESNLATHDTHIIALSEKNIGYIQHKTLDSNLYINMLILDNNHQNQGIGQAVLELIQNSCSKPLKLKCFKVNRRAFAFYQKNGFQVEDQDEVFYSLVKQIQ